MLIPAVMLGIFVLLVYFPMGDFFTNNEVSLEVLQHLSLHFAFFGSVLAGYVAKSSIGSEDLSIAVALLAPVISISAVAVGLACGNRVKLLKSIERRKTIEEIAKAVKTA